MEKHLIKKGLVITVIILFICLSITPSTAFDNVKKSFTPVSNGNTLYVGGTGPNNYTRIQDAIDNASDGDTVFVYDESSPYYENVTINKSIILLGEDKNSTIINAIDYYPVVIISAEGVKISGFTITKGRYYGIEVCSDFVTIFDNIIDSNSYFGEGITIASSHNNVSYNSFYQNGLAISSNSNQNLVYNNTVNNKPLVYYENKSDLIIGGDNGQIILLSCNNIFIKNQTISKAGIGIYLSNTYSCFISNNTISDNWRGICLFDSSYNNTISDNNLTNNHNIEIYGSSNDNIISNNNINSSFSGINIIFESCNNIVSNNSITSCNEHGICIRESCNYNLISRNTVSGNGYGISVDNSKRNIISNNTILKNEYGANLWGSKDNIISYNIISQNSDGVSIDNGCVKNKVFRNNISNNGRDGVVVSFCFLNSIYCNNIYGSGNQDAYMFNFGILFYTNRWDRNYWGRPPFPFLPPIPIFGIWRLMLYYEFKWFVFDWHPAKEPYDI